MSGLEIDFHLLRAGFELRFRAELPPTGVTVLFGPSGSGKTTVLRCLAGLEPEVRGHLRLGDRTYLESEAGVALAPHLRRVGYVFQDAALFPHLSVEGNLHFALDRRDPQREVVSWDEALAWMEIAPLLARGVERLSGGEKQRVALARALLASPSLLLFDEPFASLDRDSRRRLLPFLLRLKREVSIPQVLVTHDPEEARQLADQVYLLDKGQVRASGGLELLERESDP